MDIIKKSMKDQIYDLIRERILDEKYRFGDKINIMGLSNELGVSNTPIREAVSMLERDGLVKVTPNAGPRVIEYSPALFRQVEKAMETLILGALELNVSLDRREKLVKLLDASLKSQEKSYNSRNYHKYIQDSLGFDSCFIRCASNPFLDKMYREIYDIFYLVTLYDHEQNESERLNIINEHREILEAIRSNDIPGARSLIMQHYHKM
ncbi:MAG: GntR family transcriptional regulator [Anaerovoracaceae bacterium]|nr:GntR family transcriptional regulator [Anaerovoracaceae bacterium]